ncbi:MAG: exodeoxyribonuclease I [Kangiellaceae bacterium]
MKQPSFFWFDFETFGANPVKDKPSQFAGIRTDLDFNIIDDPINIYCKPSNDFIPHPEACLVTGITPQTALQKGVSENEFFKQIHLQLSTANTCAVGYNNIRFDDEVVRHGLYRNFYDAYAREWQNGNSRWDIIDLLRMTHALRPQGINWPKNEKGVTTFRLEKLSKANGIEHEDAHDALADVYATINMAKLVKEKQPKLFDYLFSMRDKRLVMTEIDVINHKPFVHSSGMLGSTHQYTGIMMPIAMHPTNKNSVICYDLTKHNDSFFTLSEEEIQQRIFTRQTDLPEGVERLAIKEVHFNKCPAVAPLGVLNIENQEHLGIDKEECLKYAASLIKNRKSISNKILNVYKTHQFEQVTNPDHSLYSGGFFSQSDKNEMEVIRRTDFASLKNMKFQFKDPRLETMLFRYRARNSFESLSDEEKNEWNDFRRENLLGRESHFNHESFLSSIKNIEDSNIDCNKQVLDQLKQYTDDLILKL